MYGLIQWKPEITKFSWLCSCFSWNKR